MKRRTKQNILAVLLMAMAMAVAAFALMVALRFPATEPRLLSETEDPTLAATGFLDALCARDYDTAASFLQKSPQLGLDTLPEGATEQLLTVAFRESWDYSLGELWCKDAEARLPIAFTALDLQKLTADLDEDVLALLALWLDNAQRSEELYNEDNTWREDAVLRATDSALRSRLQTPENYLSTTRLTLLLRWEDQRWVIVPDEMLYAVLSGEVRG